MKINIHISNNYAYHLGFFAHLLKLDYDIITTIKTLNFDNNYKSYYSKMLTILYQETNMYFELTMFEYFLIHNISIKDSIQTPGINIYIPDTPFRFNTITDKFITNISCIEQAEYHLRKALSDNNIISNLQYYFVDRTIHKEIIAWTINNMYNRVPSMKEIEKHYYHNGFDSKQKIDLFPWLSSLYFNKEGQNMGHAQIYSDIVKKNRSIFKIPVCAVVLSGFVEDYLTHYESHKIFINNPYIDVYIHTWKKRGHRYNYITEDTDIQDIKNKYKPIDMQIEILDSHSFSYIGKFDNIFLKYLEEHDDATRYINPRIYSLYKCYKLVEKYEKENSVTYDGIIKVNFDLEIINIDYKSLCQDILVPALYVSEKGCSECDREKKVNVKHLNHGEHYNDIGHLYFYANRIIGEKACKTYLNAYDFTLNSYAKNMILYPSIKHKRYREFIYIDDRKIECFSESTLLKTQMTNYWCLTSKTILGNTDNHLKLHGIIA